MRFILVSAILLPLFLASSECNGYVRNLEVFENYLFTGVCDDSGNRYVGITNFTERPGESFSGFYKDGGRDVGIYEFSNGEYYYGSWVSGKRNNLEYDFVGLYEFSDGRVFMGYFNGTVINGFGYLQRKTDTNDSETDFEIGIFEYIDEVASLNGYGVRRRTSGTSFVGFWKNGSAIGDIYATEEKSLESESYVKYQRNGETVYGPYNMTSSDYERLNKIVSFLSDEYDIFEKGFDESELKIESYEKVLDEEIKKVNLDSTESGYQNNIAKDETIFSIQELLSELGFSPGKPDGINGSRTRAAIIAFQLENEIEPTGIANEELLILLQLALRFEATDDNKNQNPLREKDEEVLLATGSGFQISKDVVVTNSHVVDSCDLIKDNKNNELSIITSDKVNDVALMRTAISKDFLEISSREVTLGQEIFVAGYPYSDDLDGKLNFTKGNVSAMAGLNNNISQFQFTAPIQPGNSGGPLLDSYGSVIGVAVARIGDDYIYEKTETIPQNINFGVNKSILVSLLRTNNIEYKESSKYFKPSQPKIAELASKTTILLNCYSKND